jgi:hypothetical protein
MRQRSSHRPALWRRLTAACVLSGAVVAAGPPGAAQAAPAPHDLRAGAQVGPAHTMSKDPNAERAISQAAATQRALTGDSPVEQVDRAIALFKKYHPTYVQPTTTDGAASSAEVIAAAERSRVAGAAAAGTQCMPTWARIELGAVRYRYVRPANAYPHDLYGSGVSTADWYNWFLLCRDDLWSPGDYGVYANLSGRYVYVSPSYVLQAVDDRIYDVSNLIRFKHFDSTYQTMLTPRYGFWIGVQQQGRLVVANGAIPEHVTAWHKFIVYPPPLSLPCDWAGPAC